MNRRELLKTGAVLTVGLPFMSGCNQPNIKALIQAAIASAQAIQSVAGNQSWSPQLQLAITSLQAAANAWQNGTSITDVTNALNVLEQVLAVIPATAQYAPLVALLAAGIEAVFAAVGTKSLRKVELKVGRVTLRKPHKFQTYHGAYRAQWNELADSINLAQAKI